MNKLLSLKDFLELKKEMKNQTFAMTNGCFDILHVGHVRYLNKAGTLADKLVVCLNSDKSVKTIKGETRPINNQNDRAEVLQALACVDYVVIFDEPSAADILDKIKPDIYVKGADWENKTLPEADIIKKNNIKVAFVDFVEGKSTTSIIEKIKG